MRLFKKQIKKAGFTLIETMVTLSIMASVTAASYPYVIKKVQQSQADKISGVLKQISEGAQNYYAKQDTPAWPGGADCSTAIADLVDDGYIPATIDRNGVYNGSRQISTKCTSDNIKFSIGVTPIPIGTNSDYKKAVNNMVKASTPSWDRDDPTGTVATNEDNFYTTTLRPEAAAGFEVVNNDITTLKDNVGNPDGSDANSLWKGVKDADATATTAADTAQDALDGLDLKADLNGNVAEDFAVKELTATTIVVNGDVTQLNPSPEYHLATTSSTHTNWRIAAQELVDGAFEISSGTKTAGSNANSDTYTPRIVVMNTGDIGIGVTPQEKLQVDGSILVRGNGSAGTLHGIRLLTGDSAENGGEIQVLNHNGEVAGLIDLVDGADPGDGYGVLRFLNLRGNVHIGTTSSYPVTFEAGGAERMRIDSNGNVGVSKTDPEHALDVNGTIKMYQDADITANPNTKGLRLQESLGDWLLSLGVSGVTNSGFAIRDVAAGTYPFVIREASGNIGINMTSPTEKLEVNGNIKAKKIFLDDGNGGSIEVGGPGDDGKGWTSGTYDIGTGIVTFASDDGLGFTTDDLRGADADVDNFVQKSGDTMTGTLSINNKTNYHSNIELKPNTSGKGSYIDLTAGNGTDYGLRLGKWSKSSAAQIITRTSALELITANKEAITIDTSQNTTFHGNITVSSDRRLKKDIKVLEDPLTKIKNISGVSYVKRSTNKPEIGVIAQEIEKQYPELIRVRDDGMKSVNYNGLIGVLIESVKQLSSEMNILRAETHRLRQELKVLNQKQ